MAPSSRTRKLVERSIDSTKTKHKGNSLDPSSRMKTLPMHLLTEIMARVGSSSFKDLQNIKLCCKEFGDATQDDYVIEHMEIPRDKFPVVQWRKDDKKHDSFIKHCKGCGNPEIFFREGMIDYFSRMRLEAGLDNLSRAAEKGHLEACYVLGVILAYGAKDRNSNEVLKLLHDTLERTNISVSCLRKRIINTVVRELWIKNHMDDLDVREDRANSCSCRAPKRGWAVDHDDDGGRGPCTWDCELRSFRRMLHQ